MESTPSPCSMLHEPRWMKVLLVIILTLLNCTERIASQVSLAMNHLCNQKLFTDITCAEKNSAYAECVVPTASEIVAVKLLCRVSEVDCTYRVTYGFSKNYVWVNYGCNAQFRVCYVEGGINMTTTTASPNTIDTSKTSDSEIHISWNKDIDLLLYIFIGVAILVIVCCGVAVGCGMRKRHNSEIDLGTEGKYTNSSEELSVCEDIENDRRK
ncbi:hypothetical protein CHS0354_030244 [Potamilus streckersoni]|uniref:Uncharacterized protein n=1 Tax=Potamilus streckersoni TaxID=2493646 RepID=A0AAE0VIF8_9BIVA|nr:hypothetical protein CHS0354_030244 [Potamilus streckersoni]